ncbi:hypothetical protein [Herbiconiux daphne]|uniref:Uncharacterized protein n=1 Tax=Herbiconiux daphne TaxID=2970914 RepID=A0ABT2HA99_9MICO|nr:hypothetical protein [Herbiconiux daphne]MCS5736796.1 hypothetical protein [Herbiconiux daphne]
MAVDGDQSHVAFLIRWGINNDGALDDAIGYTKDGSFTITQAESDVTLAGNKIHIWAYGLTQHYPDAITAINSPEYRAHPDNWSDLETIDVPTTK